MSGSVETNPGPRRKAGMQLNLPFGASGIPGTMWDFLVAEAQSYSLMSLKTSSQLAYDLWFKRWVWYCSSRNMPAYFHDTSCPHALQVIERHVGGFLAFIGSVLEYKVGSVKLALSAIKWHHKICGIRHPFGNLPSVYLQIKGMKRKEGGDRRKMPVTVAGLHVFISSLSWNSERGCIARAAVLTAFFFLSRISEYVPDGASLLDDKVLRWGDISFKCSSSGYQVFPHHENECMWGTDMSQSEAGELVIRIRSS